MIKQKKLLSHVKMGKEILMSGDIKIEKKNTFYLYKGPIFQKDVLIEKVLVSNKISFGKKIISTLFISTYIGYLHNDYEIKLLYIIIPETSAYVKGDDGQTKGMCLLIEDNDLLEKYSTICRRGYSVSKRLVKLTRFKSLPLQLSGHQDIPPSLFVLRHQL